jgi:hypothetical protein
MLASHEATVEFLHFVFRVDNVRKIFSRMMTDNYSFDVKLYSKDDEQFVKTDLQKLMGEDKGPRRYRQPYPPPSAFANPS